MISVLRRLVAWCNDVSNVFTLYVGTLLTGATLFAVAEQHPWLDSLWWAVVTAMTVGYGDISPETLVGRLVAMLLMHVMVFLIAPMFIGLVLSRMLEDRNAFTHEEQESLKTRLDRIEQKLG